MRAALTRLVCLVVLALAVSQACADDLAGRVVGILDGDTIDVLTATNTQVRIRLAGIDAPEKKQPFGQSSKQMLSDLVFSKGVTIEWSKKDRYGRIVGKSVSARLRCQLEDA